MHMWRGRVRVAVAVSMVAGLLVALPAASAGAVTTTKSTSIAPTKPTTHTDKATAAPPASNTSGASALTGPNLDEDVSASGTGVVMTPPVSSTGGNEVFLALVSTTSTSGRRSPQR